MRCALWAKSAYRAAQRDCQRHYPDEIEPATCFELARKKWKIVDSTIQLQRICIILELNPDSVLGSLSSKLPGLQPGFAGSIGEHSSFLLANLVVDRILDMVSGS